MASKRSVAAAGLLDTALAAGCAMLISANLAAAAPPAVSFSKNVYPIFRDNCVSCHHQSGEGYQKSGLDLSSYEGVMAGTKYGPTIVPGNAEASNLMWLLDWRASEQLRMPHNRGQLPAKFRDTIRQWIQQGAKNN